jgi:hypothetical protein
VDAGEVILEAQLPERPIDPNPLLVLPAGLMAGLVLGLGLAGLRERLDKRLHHAADVERLFGLVPLLDVRATGRGGRLRLDHDVRALYHSLRAHGPDRAEVAVLVGPDDSGTAEHLGYSLAEVAARSGASAAYVGRPHSPVLRDRRRPAGKAGEALEVSDYEQLGVLADGELRAASLGEEVRELAGAREFLVLGLPNDDPAVDLPVLGRHVDVAVVVVRLGVTRRDTLAAVLADLSKSGVDRVVAVTVDLGRRGLRRDRVGAGEAFAQPPARPGATAGPEGGPASGATAPAPTADQARSAEPTHQTRREGAGGGSPAHHRALRDDAARAVPARPRR